jgi:hypothetical protein
MNVNWYWRLAQERQGELLKEASDVQQLRDVGLRDAVLSVVKALALVLLALPFVVMLVRAVAKL